MCKWLPLGKGQKPSSWGLPIFIYGGIHILLIQLYGVALKGCLKQEMRRETLVLDTVPGSLCSTCQSQASGEHSALPFPQRVSPNSSSQGPYSSRGFTITPKVCRAVSKHLQGQQNSKGPWGQGHSWVQPASRELRKPAHLST